MGDTTERFQEQFLDLDPFSPSFVKGCPKNLRHLFFVLLRIMQPIHHVPAYRKRHLRAALQLKADLTGLRDHDGGGHAESGVASSAKHCTEVHLPNPMTVTFVAARPPQASNTAQTSKRTMLLCKIPMSRH